MQSCVLCQMEMWKREIASLTSPVVSRRPYTMAVRVVVPFNQSQRNCRFSRFVFRFFRSSHHWLLRVRFVRIFHSQSMTSHRIQRISYSTSVRLKILSSTWYRFFSALQISFCSLLLLACVCVCALAMAVDGDTGTSDIRTLLCVHRHRLPVVSLNYIIVIYSVRTSSAILTVSSLRALLLLFVLSAIENEENKKKIASRECEASEARYLNRNLSATEWFICHWNWIVWFVDW